MPEKGTKFTPKLECMFDIKVD